MSTQYFIALDVHCAFSEMAAVTTTGKLVQRAQCDTTIPALVEVLESVRHPRRLTFEEGPLAGWLSRNLAGHVDELVVCDPRRNHLVANDGDKDDPIDALKLAHLYRGGYLRTVHQSATLEQALLKQHVGFYHDRVRERVRQGQQLVALLRRQGLITRISALADERERRRLWGELPKNKLLRKSLDRLWEVYETLLSQEEEIRGEVISLARRQEPVRRFEKLPGVGPIRAITFYAYIDTPWRFRSKSALWKYCGVGLERRRSARGKNQGAAGPHGQSQVEEHAAGGGHVGHHAAGESLCREVSPLERGGRTARLHGPAQYGEVHRVDHVEPLENRRRIRSGAGASSQTANGVAARRANRTSGGGVPMVALDTSSACSCRT